MAAPQTKPATGTETVIIVSKIPQGMTLQLHEKREISISTNVGVTKELRHYPIEDAVFTIAGSAHPQDKAPRADCIGAYAITRGVPKDFWDKWMEQTGQFHRHSS